MVRTPLEFNRKKMIVDTQPEPVLSDENKNTVNIDIAPSIIDQDIFGPCIEDKTTALIEEISSVSIAEKQPEQESSSNLFSKSLVPPNSLANISMALDNPPMPTLRTIGSGDFLSPSPIFGLDSFDTQSLDELATPDDYGAEQFAHGLTNVNYDIDLSDLSAENSAAEDLDSSRPKAQDPFSPDGIAPTVYWQSVQPESLQPLESVKLHRPLIPVHGADESISILDAADSPTADCLLPSPLKPNTFQSLTDSSK